MSVGSVAGKTRGICTHYIGNSKDGRLVAGEGGPRRGGGRQQESTILIHNSDHPIAKTISHPFRTPQNQSTIYTLMVIQWQLSPLEFLPIQIFIALALLHHGDAIFHRTNQLAQIAAHTFFFLDGIGIIGFAISKTDGLV